MYNTTSYENSNVTFTLRVAKTVLQAIVFYLRALPFFFCFIPEFGL